MFKTYLENFSHRTQLSIFFFIWAAFFLLTNGLQLMMLGSYIPEEVTERSMSYLIEHHPQTIKALNFMNSLMLFFIPAFLFAYLRQAKPLEYLNLHKKHGNLVWAYAFIFALILIPVLISLGGVLKEYEVFGEVGAAMQEQRDQTFQLYFQDKRLMNVLLNLVLLALVPAITEEFLFRGVLQRLLMDNFKSPWIGIIGSALVFALLHFSVYEFIPIFLAGLLFALVYYYSRSLKLTILMHFINNGMQVIMMSVGDGEDVQIAGWKMLIVFIVSAGVLLVMGNLLRAKLKKENKNEAINL